MRGMVVRVLAVARTYFGALESDEEETKYGSNTNVNNMICRHQLRHPPSQHNFRAYRVGGDKRVS